MKVDAPKMSVAPLLRRKKFSFTLSAAWEMNTIPSKYLNKTECPMSKGIPNMGFSPSP